MQWSLYTYACTQLRRLVLRCGVGPPLKFLSLSQHATATDYPPTARVSIFCKAFDRPGHRQAEVEQGGWGGRGEKEKEVPKGTKIFQISVYKQFELLLREIQHPNGTFLSNECFQF